MAAGATSLSIPFEPNVGQLDERVAYRAQTFAGPLLVTRSGALELQLVPPRSARAGVNPAPLVEMAVDGTSHPAAGEPAITRVNYLVGADQSRWHRNVPTYADVQLGEVWPGVRVHVRAFDRNVEKIFTVAPGGSVADIRMTVSGAQRLERGAGGELRLDTAVGAVTYTAPIAFQEIDGRRIDVPVRYTVAGTSYGFAVGEYDRTRPLVIDPIIQSTYLGGDVTGTSLEESAESVAVHPTTGDVYLAGGANSAGLATAGAAQATFSGSQDAFVARLNAGLTQFLQVTYLGGGVNDQALGLVVTADDVWVGGQTSSNDFPGTAGGAQATDPNGAGVTASNGFVARLPLTLDAVTNATYFGGTTNNATEIRSLIQHPNGDLYACGNTFSGSLPATTGGFDAANNAGTQVAFVLRLNTALTAFGQATYFGTGNAVICNSLAAEPGTGQVFAAGTSANGAVPSTAGGALDGIGGTQQGWVARFSADLTTAPQASYTIGSGRALTVRHHPVNGDIYVTGNAGSGSTTVPPGALTGAAQGTCATAGCQYVWRFDPSLTSVTGGTYFSRSTGSITLSGREHLLIDADSGDVFLTGQSGSGLPSTSGGFFASPAGSEAPGFVARLAASLGTIVQATYLQADQGGMNPRSLALSPVNGDLYVAGLTTNDTLPFASGGAQATYGGGSDVFAMRVTADLRGQPVTPGVLQFSATEYQADEGSGTLVATVTRTNGSDGAVSVQCSASSLSGNNATAGADYTAVSPTLNWANGDTASKSCTVPILEDALVEGNETFTLVLSSPTGGATIGSQDSAGAIIVDNDSAGTLQFTAATFQAGEGAGNLVATVSRSGGTAGAVSITCAASTQGGNTATAGTDYTAVSATLNWAAGDSANKSCTVPVADDAAVEGSETFTLTLSAPTGGATLGAPATATATIVDNDVAPPPPGNDVTVTGSYGGGGSVEWLTLGSLLSLLAWRRRSRVSRVVRPLAGAALGLVAGSTLVSLPAAAAEPGVYAGVRGGLTYSTLDDGDLSGAIDAVADGASASADSSDFGGTVYVGFRFLPWLALEAGYVQLGEYDVTLQAEDTAAGAVIDSAVRAVGDAGRGVSVTARFDVPLGERFTLVPRAGVHTWDSEIELTAGSQRRKSTRDGLGVTGGLAVGYAINDQWNVGLSADYFVPSSRNEIVIYGLQVEYAFGTR
jgi:hypothetical protein